MFLLDSLLLYSLLGQSGCCYAAVTFLLFLPYLRDFPDITFKVFSGFIKENFSSHITLSTVLLVLFSLTDNTDLLNLHAQQQNPTCKAENKVYISGWLKSLCRALTNRLGEKTGSLLHKSERSSTPSQKINLLGEKLDDFEKLLELYPYDKNGKFQGKLEPTSHKAIQPVLIICPNSAFCVAKQCKQRSLLQHTLSNDDPQVTLIKNT